MYSIDPTRERRLLWLLMLTQFTLIMDFMVMMPLGPQIMRALHISPAQFAAAVSAYSICGGLSGLLAATYIDRFDRRKLLLAMYALFALSNLACALAGSYELLLASRAFAGVSGGVLGSIIMAIIADVIPAQRRGAATGTVMTAFAVASVIGVPVGILLGAHSRWSAPFWLLVALSLLIWLAGARVVPPLDQHLSRQREPLARALPNLIGLFANARHLNAFALTLMLTTSQMLVIPFISPMLVANHGIEPSQLSWMYMAGGVAAFFTSRLIGRLADRHGKQRVYRIAVAVSLLPVLFVTHLPAVGFLAMLLFFPFFMVSMNGRMVPLQALQTTVPQPQQRGAFLSANSAVMSLGTGLGAWLGGLMLSTDASGHIAGYGTVGWVAAGLALCSALWVGRVSAADAPAVATATESAQADARGDAA
ncbi:transporter, major facilitator superfamily [Lysobacter enzymogenes]|uniref:Transporter, major facilitator superfamily n=1 Tax=Lysobacter enzymogenes TaxID=69 RepID=A0A0S2DBA9_LYSEN|nr:MFS transporter [Lysobacter enzymogenes]ALN55822.1 transporter, major facilitator superfamily [Lysobacter enzymogenes]QCW24806.1 MFS transporter [Lysobacter enzymogenes]